MERRKILLGSGAALATVLAGCSSTETGDENPDDGDDGMDDDNGDDGYDDNGDDGNDGNDGDDGDDGDDDVPGFDDDMDSESDVMTVMEVDREDDRLYVVTQTETTDPEVLSQELETVAHDIADAVTDPDSFKAEISTVEWVLEYEGSHVLAVLVDVEWVVDYIKNELSEDEYIQKVLDAKEE
ncbi:hypothetical protein SAMN05444422_10283 [Halobiforma haloterrestris]|uniref:DUF8159 domain-containing protein n=1 Tax=Natronobacterium haloterrestre TaxID=148448 RepID=A0A1I1E4G3_NATHA|nr:hypothetical protein [Halobiforma haloterrestris]SFB80098.1 hypothetical protein SAMN05444422_10283 [Halobiforma haloterrestris]